MSQNTIKDCNFDNAFPVENCQRKAATKSTKKEWVSSSFYIINASSMHIQPPSFDQVRVYITLSFWGSSRVWNAYYPPSLLCIQRIFFPSLLSFNIFLILSSVFFITYSNSLIFPSIHLPASPSSKGILRNYAFYFSLLNAWFWLCDSFEFKFQIELLMGFCSNWELLGSIKLCIVENYLFFFFFWIKHFLFVLRNLRINSLLFF